MYRPETHVLRAEKAVPAAIYAVGGVCQEVSYQMSAESLCVIFRFFWSNLGGRAFFRIYRNFHVARHGRAIGSNSSCPVWSGNGPSSTVYIQTRTRVTYFEMQTVLPVCWETPPYGLKDFVSCHPQPLTRSQLLSQPATLFYIPEALVSWFGLCGNRQAGSRASPRTVVFYRTTRW